MSNANNEIAVDDIKDAYRGKLAEIIEEVFQNMAFLFCDPVEDDFKESDLTGLRARMVFHGVLNGDMTIWLEQSIIHELAINMLGLEIEDELGTSEYEDALKELLNVLVGQFLVAAAGDEPLFDLSVPILLDESKSDFSTLWKSTSAIKYLIDDRPIIINCHCEKSE